LPLTELVDRYVILEKIAQGGMGAIYKAQDKRLKDKIVAVKEMSESAIAPSDRERVLEAFHREAQLLARLRHPNLVRVTDRFEKDERYFMVMEFIPGRTLDAMLREQKARGEPFPEERVLAWADQLCDVLSYLHRQTPKIIYRDVKPANVMIVEGTDTVKLIDFGITRFYKPGKKKDTIEFGTDGYAPPEQYGKAQTDERADVYALGVTLHELLTLHDPVTKLFDFPPPRRLNPNVSRRVAKAITKALESSRNDRHQSMEEMRTALLGDDAAIKTHRPIPSLSSGRLALTPAVLDFGHVPVGGAAPNRSLQFTPPAGEKIKLSTDASWLHVQPRSVDKQKGRATVTLDTSRLRPGRLTLQGGPLKRWVGWHTRLLVPNAQEQHGHVTFESKGGPVGDAPVSVTVVPPRWQVYAGWIVTLGAILLEIAIIIGLVGLLILIG
jgi:serine/threonine protein kinase